MSSPLDNLEPKSLWSHFDLLRSTPRASGSEKQVRDKIEAWAKQLGYGTRVDAAGNLVVKVPATPGRETAPIVVLQGHLDMVCEKNEGTAFDFDTEPITILRDGDWIHADNTTLGADNGIGVAASMAAADDPSVVRGPLELLFTVQEETGLDGAFALDGRLLDGRILLNLDSEEWGDFFVGCAGGGNSTLELALKRAPATAGHVALTLRVDGLLGGHSGLNIVDNRANAVKLLAYTLQAFRRAGVPFALTTLHGGDKHNAIPREAWAVLTAAPADVPRLGQLAAARKADFLLEFGAREPALDVSLKPRAEAGSSLDGATRDRVIDLLIALPHGVDTMSQDIKGMVETSTNVARVRVEGDVLTVLTSTRSSVKPPLENLRDRIRAIADLSGATITHGEAYPGWQPDMTSPLLKTCEDVYEKLHGRRPRVTAIHAGLECGVIGERVPGMRMMSFGPDLRDVHSPREKVSISTTALFWDYLKALLAELSA
jgi:dipeptidase D